jgi:hypothetical protein
MNDRARALAILKQAREILLARLTERVLDNEETILDDARGESYMGEIDALYEQIGSPLAHVNQILSNLPADEAHEMPETHATHAAAHSYAEIVPPAWPEVPALPAPRSSGGGVETAEDPAATAPISFQTFAVQIQAEDVHGAGASLAYLFDISLPRATRCAEHFLMQLRADPNFLTSAMQLRKELATGGYNGALMLLYECFGLTGMESIGVYQALKTRVQMGG